MIRRSQQPIQIFPPPTIIPSFIIRPKHLTPFILIPNQGLHFINLSTNQPETRVTKNADSLLFHFHRLQRAIDIQANSVGTDLVAGPHPDLVAYSGLDTGKSGVEIFHLVVVGDVRDGAVNLVLGDVAFGGLP